MHNSPYTCVAQFVLSRLEIKLLGRFVENHACDLATLVAELADAQALITDCAGYGGIGDDNDLSVQAARNIDIELCDESM